MGCPGRRKAGKDQLVSSWRPHHIQAERLCCGRVSSGVARSRHNHESATIEDLLDKRRHDSALEIGSGFGRLTPVFGKFTDELISLEVNPAAIEMARLFYRDQTYVEGSVTSIPFGDDRFDLIISWTVLQHLPPDQFGSAANEIMRVLKPGGTLLLCEETRYPDMPTHSQTHTWHRTVDMYRRAFYLLDLLDDFFIEGLERIPEIQSPGRVMRFGAISTR